MNKGIRIIGVLLGAGVLILAAWLVLRSRQPLAQASARISQPLSLPAEGFLLADSPREFHFPQDHGPHPEYQTEWWYYTGNLEDEAGNRYGYQLTFFRRGLAAPQAIPSRESSWATGQVYMAHFAITDVPGNKFRSFERLERGAAGLAGASIDPVYHVWLEDWSVTGDGEGSTHLSAREENLSLDLTLVESKPPVLQGDAGLSQKGAQPGNASYYYSLTRLESTGTLQLEGGKEFAVKGLSWMDHEFSTSALSHGQIGWDWFALQLSDGQDLMVFNLRQADGAPDPYSSGSLISADGMKTTLSRQDFTINPLMSWVSSYSQARYPSGWQVDVPEAGISLEITPLLEDQENRLTYTYWEGAVAINGTVAGSPVSGYGYVELTGYAASMQGEF